MEIADRFMLHVITADENPQNQLVVKHLGPHMGLNPYQVSELAEQLTRDGLVRYVRGDNVVKPNRETRAYRAWITTLPQRLNGESEEYTPIIQREMSMLGIKAYAHAQ